MPAFKHPCLHCGKYIARDVVRCPFCGTIDPFVASRCPTCRTGIEDASWVACPSCGEPLKEGVAPMPGAAPIDPATPVAASRGPAAAPASPPPASPPPASPPPASPPAAAGSACPACNAALAPGARFCTVCGTLVG